MNTVFRPQPAIRTCNYPLIEGNIWRANSHDAFVKIRSVSCFDVELEAAEIGMHADENHVNRSPFKISVGDLRSRYHHSPRYQPLPE
jgi:hypothetical protein